MLAEQLSTEQKVTGRLRHTHLHRRHTHRHLHRSSHPALQERQFREKVQRSTAMKLEAEMRAEGAALLDGLKGQLAHMAAVDYGVPTSPY